MDDDKNDGLVRLTTAEGSLKITESSNKVTFLLLGFCSLNVAQTRNAAVPDSFNLAAGGVAIAAVARVGTAACVTTAPAEFVGIGGNLFCGALLAGTDNDATAGVITCNYK